MNKYSISELLILSQSNPIIAFDGVCNLCDGFIHWLIKKDKKKIFRYVTLQSEIGNELLKASGENKETVVLAYNGVIYSYSDVGLKSMEILGGLWKGFSYLAILPKGFRDFVYHFISRNRYKWFGKKDKCMVPTKEVIDLFL